MHHGKTVGIAAAFATAAALIGVAAGGYVTVPWSFFSTGDVDELYAVGKLAQG